MRNFFLLLVCAILICSSATAEEYASVSQGTTRPFCDYFLCEYCEESDTYWFMTREHSTFLGHQIHLFPKNKVYCMSGDFSTVTYMFSRYTDILALLPTKDKLFYRSVKPYGIGDIYCFDIASGSNKLLIEEGAKRLIAASLNNLLFLNAQYDLTERSLFTGKDRIITTKPVVSYNNDAAYYREDDGSITAYSYQSGTHTPCNIPPEIDVNMIRSGYIIDDDNDRLYRFNEECELVTEMEFSYAYGLDENYVCAFFTWSELSKLTGELRYARLSNPTELITIDIERYLNDNMNLCNGFVFFYTENAKSICAVNLATGEKTTIALP